MATMNKNARNPGRFDDDDNTNNMGNDAGGDGAFNNGLWNADNFSSTALNPPAGAGDPPAAASFASIPTLADYLINGYWAWSGYGGTGARDWDHTTLTVNITDLTAAEQTIAQTALGLWHDVTNINFSYTTGAADIRYINDGSGSAVTSYSVSSGNISGATVHISSDWSGGAATGNYSYFFQTYVHETGHALGLGHQGPYNGSSTYGVDNIYTNDTWRWSVMSYHSQNNYGSDTYDYVLTPQMADIYAVQAIYGAQTTRTGDTTYGFNSNAGSFWNFSTYSGTPAFTIYDSGGTDTIDASGYSNAQTIDLTPGNWSSIGGETSNIGIYLTTTIEIAKGGSGADIIYGNDANNSLYGNGGADTLKGGGGADYLSGDAGDDLAERRRRQRHAVRRRRQRLLEGRGRRGLPQWRGGFGYRHLRQFDHRDHCEPVDGCRFWRRRRRRHLFQRRERARHERQRYADRQFGRQHPDRQRRQRHDPGLPRQRRARRRQRHRHAGLPARP